MADKEYNDYPLLESAREAQKVIEELGATVWQKWTCGHCGSRQTMEQENSFYTSGRCEECDQITVISKCNFLMQIGGSSVRHN